MVQAIRLLFLTALVSAPAIAQQAPTCSISVSPVEAFGNTDVTVTWATTGAVTCVASGGWAGPKDCAGGSQVLAVSQSRTFTLSARASTGKVTAKYTKPTQNTDGTAAVVTGFKLFIADAPSGLASATPIILPVTPLEYVFWRAPGDVSAGIKAIRSDGVESAMSNIASKTVSVASTSCAATVTINPRVKAPSLTLSWLKEISGF